MVSLTHYRALWHFDSRTGSLILVTNDAEHRLDNLSAADFHACVDILRNERPVQYDPATQTLATLSEIIGEGEMR